MTIKEKLKHLVAWLVLYGPNLVKIVFFSTLMIIALVYAIAATIEAPLLMLGSLVFWGFVFGCIYVAIRIHEGYVKGRSKIASWAHQVLYGEVPLPPKEDVTDPAEEYDEDEDFKE
ncbi:MAG: hypothetical protein WC761_02065 [Candidatus Paceibacterota bacterium]|jgi:hypothetical protein